MPGNIGLIAALALLIWLALRGANILLAALLAAVIVALTNQLSLAATLTEYFTFGPLGAFTFAGKFLLLFLAGAIFGKAMAVSQAASSIAQAIIHWLGVKNTLWVTMLVCAVLTYGGVVVFVVIFTMYPLGVALMQAANLPKRLFCAAIALGAGTFTMTALPGSPSIHNVLAASALGTDLFAGATLGIAASLLMAGLGMAYLQRQWRQAQQNNEGFVASAQDTQIAQLAAAAGNVPHWRKALLPILLVLALIMLPRILLMTGLFDAGISGRLLQLSQQQPVLWPSLALLLATMLAILLFPVLRRNTLQLLGSGADDAILPLISTAAVIGFGGVVTKTAGFASFSQWILTLDLPPLLSLFASVSVVSGIVGSSSGGLQIFLQTLAPHYLQPGITPELLHRVATIAAGGFDSLPHCGAVIAMLMIMGLNHKQAYKDIFVVTVLVPVFALLVCLAVLAM
ncbi:GntP family permease [Rheinheimera oceanensis]|uniref:GntP family permease n=1 Tax=Rheinheimera oceanensis TaxID=2817449 RepID=UPI001BFD161C|nr:GntP family permease [Rheinheimera oceanensis]